MMKLFGMSMAAVLAFAALSAASASASQPKFVLEEGATTTFKGKGNGGTLETVGGDTVTCNGESSTGEINSETTVKGVVITFTGCKASFGLNCTTSGQSTGTIVTKATKGTLVYYKENTADTAVLLEPESGTVFATFTCAFSTVTVEKSVLGVYTPVNPPAFTKTATLTFTQAKGIQSPNTYLNPSGCAAVASNLESKAAGFPSFALQKSGIEGASELESAVGVKVEATKCT